MLSSVTEVTVDVFYMITIFKKKNTCSRSFFIIIFFIMITILYYDTASHKLIERVSLEAI